MPLIFGFRRDSDFWKEKYKKLPEDAQEWFHGSLPFCMMAWQIGHISTESIEEIIIRELYLSPHPMLKHTGDNMEEKEVHLRNMLLPFIGYTANVYTECTREYLMNKTQDIIKKSTYRTRQMCDSSWKKYEKEFKEMETEDKT